MLLVPILGYMIMRILWHTSRKSFHIEGELTQEQHIYVCWHGELFMSPQAYRYLHKTQPAAAMISHHFDGELIARVYAFLKIGSIRGSGRKGAKEVFLKAFRALKEGTELLITPDGLLQMFNAKFCNAFCVFIVECQGNTVNLEQSLILFYD